MFLPAKSIYKTVIATNEKEPIVLLATYTVILFVTIRFDYRSAQHVREKQLILVTIELLGYCANGRLCSGANLLGFLVQMKCCQVSIAEDEFDKIGDDSYKQRIYKINYGDIKLVTKTVDPSSSNRDIRSTIRIALRYFPVKKVHSESREIDGFNERGFLQERLRRVSQRFRIKERKNR